MRAFNDASEINCPICGKTIADTPAEIAEHREWHRWTDPPRYSDPLLCPQHDALKTAAGIIVGIALALPFWFVILLWLMGN